MEQALYTLFLQDVHFLLGCELEQAARINDLAEHVDDRNLRAIFTQHAEETDAQAQRLQDILTAVGEDTDGEVPLAMDGMIEDAETIAEMELGEVVQDFAIAAAAQKIEHYEIACYQSAIALAEHIGMQDSLAPLRQSLEEERRADGRFAAIATQILPR